MIADAEKVKKELIAWIKEQAKLRNKKKLLIRQIHLEDYYNTEIAFLTKLCKLTGLETELIDDEDIHNDYTFRSSLSVFSSSIKNAFIYDKIVENNALLIGSINKNEYELVRNYHRLDPSDILPLAELYRSEILELLNDNNEYNGEKCFYFINKGINSLSFAELEWLSKENKNTKIITNDIDPIKNPAWPRLNTRQKTIVAMIHQIEKETRFKYNPNIPVCNIRKEGFVR